MSEVVHAAGALAVLGAAGAGPVAVGVGARWVAVPLAPLAGAVVAGLAATATVAVGGPFLAWFLVGAAAGAAPALGRAVRVRRGADGRGAVGDGAVGDGAVGDGAVGDGAVGDGAVGDDPPGTGRRARALAAVAVLAAVVVGLRGLATPSVGFDARVLWVMRGGWFLHDHHQLLVDLRLPQLLLFQTGYPPLVSAAVSVAWAVTGDHSVRLGVVVVALLNGCALAVAALGVVEAGRRAARTRAARTLGWVPAAAGAVAAVLLVGIAAGVTSPFLTNGYADPLWSLASVGAVCWGLQLADGRRAAAVAAVLVVVAGLTKNEGTVEALALVVLLGVRAVVRSPGDWRRVWPVPALVAAVEAVLVLAWPLTLRLVHGRDVASTHSALGAWPGRMVTTARGMAPSLHVLVLAAVLSVVGGIGLAAVRRSVGLAADGWAWLALGVGLAAVTGAVVSGTVAVDVWLLATVHRITQFPALAAWWIVALWAVVAATAVADRAGGAVPTTGAGREASTDPTAATVVAG